MSPGIMKARYSQISGKTVVITGATSGVGRAAALLFAEHGARVVLAARREAVLDELAYDIVQAGGSALAVVTDVTTPNAHKELARQAASYGIGRIDVWINNAGVLAVGALEDTPVEVQIRVIQTNLLGYMYGATAVLPYFKEQGYGVLINNISVGGWLPVPFGTAYSASKTGLWGFTGALQAELSNHKNIHVCGLYPAMLDTPGVQHAANFTGKALKAAPPVFDPNRVAKAMLEVAIKPKRTTTTDFAAPLMRLGYLLAPQLTGTIANAVFRNYFRKAPAAGNKTGNLFDDNTPYTTVKGGWLASATYKRDLARFGLIGAGAVAGLMLLLRRRAE